MEGKEWGNSWWSIIKDSYWKGKRWTFCTYSGSSSSKPQQTLTLGINVLIDKSCGGCKWHEFPYKIRSIISSDRGKQIEFEDVNDGWDYIILLKEESENQQRQGSLFTTLNDIYEQLPFFCCYNNILDEDSQKDIAKYLYCNETNTPPYTGSYGETPVSWIEKYFIIKSTLEMRNKKLLEKNKNDWL